MNHHPTGGSSDRKSAVGDRQTLTKRYFGVESGIRNFSSCHLIVDFTDT